MALAWLGAAAAHATVLSPPPLAFPMGRGRGLLLLLDFSWATVFRNSKRVMEKAGNLSDPPCKTQVNL